MAPKGQKRDAAAAKKAPASKKIRAETVDAAAVIDPVMTAIVGTVEQAEDLPQNCRSMLVAGLKGSLNTPSDDRHQVQSMVVGMLEEVIVAKQARLQEQLDGAKANTLTVEDAKAALAKKLNEAEVILVEKVNIFDEKQQAHTVAKDKAASAAAAHSEKQALQASGDAVMLEKQTSKATIEKAIEKDFKAIQEGSGGCNDLLPVISTLCFDESLIKALPGTCARPPAERGSFDAMVLSQLELSLKDTLTELTKAVEAEVSGVKERAEAVDVAHANMQIEATCQNKAEEEQTAAEAARLETVAVVDAIKKEIAEHKPKERNAVTSCDRFAAELEAFKQNIRVPFEARRDAKAKVATPEVSEMTVEAVPAVEASPAKVASPQAKGASPKAELSSPAGKGVAPIEEHQGASVTAGGA